MINWGAFQTLPSFSPIRHTTSGWSDMATPLSDKFLDVPGVDPDELFAGIRQEWQTCGADPNLARKVALKNIEENPHYYSSLAKYDIKEESGMHDNKDVNAYDLFAGMTSETAKGLSVREAGIEALGKLSKKPNFYKANTVELSGSEPFGSAQTTCAAASMDSDKTPSSANLRESANKHPIGMVQVWKFFQQADDAQIANFNSLLQKGQYDKGWEAVQELIAPKSDAVDGDHQKVHNNPEKMEKIAENQIHGSASSSTVDEETDPTELAMGITVEMEHTDDDLVAAELAKDHLKKDGNYYTKLQKAGLADECAPALSSGLGDASHPINKKFRVGNGVTPTAGHNIVKQPGSKPIFHSAGKKEYKEETNEVGDQPADWSLKGAMRKVFPQNKNLVKKETITMKKPINENLFVRPTKVFNPKYKKAINEMAIIMKVGFPTIEKLNAVATKYTETIQEAQELVEDYCDSYKVGYYKKLLALNENSQLNAPQNGDAQAALQAAFESGVTDPEQLEDAIMGHFHDPQDAANFVNQFLVTHQSSEVHGKGANLAPCPAEMTAPLKKETVKDRYEATKKTMEEILSVLGSSYGIKEIGAADDLGKDGQGYSWAAEPGASIKPYEDKGGKMTTSNIKETLTKKLTEMEKCYGTGDYEALTKHTTNGQISMLEKIKEAVKAKQSLHEAKRSEYKKFFGV